MLLFYIRHGDPIYNPDCLTDLGKKQADALSKRLAIYGLDEIYASTSNRAIQTAEPTAKLLNKPIHKLDWCNEHLASQYFKCTDVNSKDKTWVYQNQRAKELFVSKEIYKLGNRWYKHKFFASGTYEEGTKIIKKEAFSFLEKQGYRRNEVENLYDLVFPNEKRIALFAHEGIGMVFLSTILGIPYPLFCTHNQLSHSSMTVIYFPNKNKSIPQILQLSNDSHLYKEQMSTRYNDWLDI